MIPPLIEAVRLTKRFERDSPAWRRWLGRPSGTGVDAVIDVGFTVSSGRTLGLVGESGSGKTTVGRMLVGLERPTSGDVRVNGEPFGPAHRRAVQMVFQDPSTSLDPRWRAGRIVGEPLAVQRSDLGLAARRERVAGLLASVGLAGADAHRFPHQFSGGQRQRIAIARALAVEPAFLVCDEPTSALDVSVQAQVLNLMKDIQDRTGVAYLFISHNLAVVRHMSDDVGVMLAGRLVELAAAEALFNAPRHPYTRLLLDAVPRPGRRAVAAATPADEPLGVDRGAGCPFKGRCPLVAERCHVEAPALRPAGEATRVACHAVEERRD